MNCHDNHNENGNHKHSPVKHMLHMVLCCGIPIVIIFLLPYIAKYNAGVAAVLGIITPFICPILMIGMMVFMYRNNKKIDVAEKSEQIVKSEE